MTEEIFPYCICSEYDGRGRSVCGTECPQHPLNGKCPSSNFKLNSGDKCYRKTHNSVWCVECADEEGE